MISVSGNNWEEIIVNKRIVEKVQNELNLTEINSKIIISRKFNKLEIDSLFHQIEITNPFFKNEDFINGVKILDYVLEKNLSVLVVGDYDVDGCVSTSLFINFFKNLNKKIDFYIPNRISDGYGVNLDLIKKLIKKKPDLIIMVDCGSNSKQTIDFLNKKKIKTIIIDHHEIYKPYPKSNSLINPKKECNYNDFDYLCSSSLSYFFLDLYIKKKKLKFKFNENLIYVLLATICDVMPLRNLNRILALNVLKDFDLNTNHIFKKILEFRNIKRSFNIDDLGFLIGPIFNSAGRLKDANIVVDLLTNNNNKFKDKIINQLILINERRKKVEHTTLNEINLDLILKKRNLVLIEYQNIINEGIIGIIAARLCNLFNKPSVVLTKNKNLYKASARSISNFNIGKYIKECIDNKIILNGGGHNLAAGFTIKKENIKKFEKYINNIFQEKNLIKSKHYISKISLSAINYKFYNDLKILAPFGEQNENPLFLVENVKIIKPKILKNKFLTFYIKSKSNRLIAGISFNLLESEINKNLLYNKNQIDLIVQIKENLWNNKKSLQLIVKDMITHSNKA